ncbi:hypothetical protein Baya_4828 [Bagarius yarrelli]|uniref:Immunoglobulin domain-containing protein n=1 Tax=Bagarius yarrelli TaxID=175774 RepID=A0A556TRP3_BAGYA|nr:hypothetical protein Baya_4828 [Bagarius yarrelli]
MWVFTVIFLVLCPSSLQDDCSRSVSMSHNGYVDVVLGQRFNLTCNFNCFTAAHKVQLMKDELLLSELSLSSDCPESKHTIVLLLFIPAVQYNDSGLYKCRSDPRDGSSSVTIKVVTTDENMDKDEHNITGNAPLWYFLCKTALFLICSLSAVWIKTCSVQ